MKCSTLMLANAVEVRDSMLYVLGGDPDWWSVPSENGPFGGHVAISLILESGEADVEHPMALVLADDAGDVIRGNFNVRVTRTPGMYVAGAPFRSNLTVGLQGPIRQMGSHAIRLFSGDQLLAETTFGIRLIP